MFALMRTMLIANFDLNALRVPRRRWRMLATFGLIALGVAPLAVAYTLAIGTAYAAMEQQGLPLQDMLLAGIYALAQITVLFTSLTVAHATLLRARDLSILLPLPYRPAQIVAAKLAVVWLVELAIGGAFFLPPLVQHLLHTGAGPLRWLAAAPLALAMPVIPLCAGTLLVLLVGNIPGLGRNRWFWQLLLTSASLVAWLMLRQVVNPDRPVTDVMDLVQVKMRQFESIGRQLPGSLFAIRALTASGPAAVVNFLLALAAPAGAVGVVLLVANRLYLRPVLEGAGAGARGRGRAEASRPRPFLLSCARKEIACVLREPVVAMNALGAYVAVPIGVTVSLLSRHGADGPGAGGGLRALAGWFASPDGSALRPVAAAGLGLAAATLGTLSSLFSASWSKDGRRLWIERSLPVEPFALFLGRWLGAMTIASTAHLAAMTAAGLLLRLPAGTWLYAWLTGELALAAAGTLGLAIDAARPKLDWKETVQAVKQNANVVFGMLACVALLAVNAAVLVGCVSLALPPAVAWLAPVAVNLGALAVAMLAGRAAAARLAELDI